MGAIAISKEDEEQIRALIPELKAKSKAQVVREALRLLKEKLDQEKLRVQIQDSVRRCAQADRRENRLLFSGGSFWGSSRSSRSWRS